MTVLYGIEFTDKSLNELAKSVLLGEAGLIVTANLDHLSILRRDLSFRLAYRSANVRTIDGFPVLMLSRLAGQKNSIRIPGSDLAKVVLDQLRGGKHRPMFIVSNEATREAIQKKMFAQNFHPSDIEAVVAPFGFEHSEKLTAGLRQSIMDFRPSHVFFGLGAPKSEIWCSTNRDCLGSSVVLCVGSGVNTSVGTLIRAPQWMRSLGGEWVWRAMQEPNRLGRRYLRNAALLPFFVLQAVEQRRMGPNRRYNLLNGEIGRS